MPLDGDERPLCHGTIFRDINILSRVPEAKSTVADEPNLSRSTEKLLQWIGDRAASEDGDPGKTRTSDTQFRKLLLYPPELRGHVL